MQDILKDVVSHTYALGFLPLVRITSDSNSTEIESVSEDRTVILMGRTKTPVKELQGAIGLPNMSLLAFHLKNKEYDKDAKIDLIVEERNGEKIPTRLQFENSAGDFKNSYHFMHIQHLNEKMKKVSFKGAQWNIEFDPSQNSISRLKLQSSANPDEVKFLIKEKDGNLVFSFGEDSSHNGEFVFKTDIKPGSLMHSFYWPIAPVNAILNMDGQITLKISDQGAMMISVDSGMAVYDYVLPALTK